MSHAVFEFQHDGKTFRCESSLGREERSARAPGCACAICRPIRRTRRRSIPSSAMWGFPVMVLVRRRRVHRHGPVRRGLFKRSCGGADRGHGVAQSACASERFRSFATEGGLRRQQRKRRAARRPAGRASERAAPSRPSSKLEHARVDVALAAHRRRVAERLRRGLDRFPDVRAVAGRVSRRAPTPARWRAARTVPPQVRKSLLVRRRRRSPCRYALTSAAEIERTPSPSWYWNRTSPGRSRQRRITDTTRSSSIVILWCLPDLPRKSSTTPPPALAHVAVAQGRRAERAVLAAIALAADANEGLIHQAHDRRQHALLAQRGQAQVAHDGAPDARQHAARNRAASRTCWSRARRSTPGGSDTACARARPCRWPAGDRADWRRSRRRSTPAG